MKHISIQVSRYNYNTIHIIYAIFNIFRFLNSNLRMIQYITETICSFINFSVSRYESRWLYHDISRYVVYRFTLHVQSCVCPSQWNNPERCWLNGLATKCNKTNKVPEICLILEIHFFLGHICISFPRQMDLNQSIWVTGNYPIHFLKWKYMNFVWDFTEVCS